MTNAAPPPVTQTWQDTLDPRLLQRLLRPLRRPGVGNTRLVDAILARLQAMARPQPMLAALAQRYGSTTASRAGQVPIVYAQPWPDEGAPGSVSVAPVPSPQRPGVPAPVPSHNPGAADAFQPLLVHSQVVRLVEQRAAQPFGTPARVGQHAARTGSAAAPAPVVHAQRRQAGMRSESRQAARGAGPAPLAAPQPFPRVLSVRAERPGLRQGIPAVPAPRPVVRPLSRTVPVPLAPGAQNRAGAPAPFGRAPGVYQYAAQRPVVAETRRPLQPRAPVPVPLALAAPPGQTNGSRAGHAARPGEVPRPADRRLRGRSGERVGDTTGGRRLAPGAPAAEPPAAPARPASPAAIQADAAPQIDLKKLAQRVQEEIDLGQLVEKVQRQLRRRLVIERERRGW